jgi:hypothetical protein
MIEVLDLLKVNTFHDYPAHIVDPDDNNNILKE